MATMKFTLVRYTGENDIRIINGENIYNNFLDGKLHPSKMFVSTWENGPYGHPWNQWQSNTQKGAKETFDDFLRANNPRFVSVDETLWSGQYLEMELVF